MAYAGEEQQQRQFTFEQVFAEADPYPHYAWYREHDPVHLGEPFWPLGFPLVHLFRHQDVRTWLRDARMVKEASAIPGVRERMKEQGWTPPESGTMRYQLANSMLFQDPPDHTRLRSLANRAFTPRVVGDRRDAIEAIMQDLVAAFQEEHNGSGDLIGAVAFPLPVMVIATILGVPGEDMHRFRDWSSVIAASIDVEMERLAAMQDRADQVAAELHEYLGYLIDKRRSDPQDDLITGLIAAREDEDRLSDDELLSMITLLLVAGHETTVNLIGNGTLALMRNRDQWETLVADPSLAGNAAEELLRYDSPIQFTGRIVSEDLEINGVQVPRGSQVAFWLASGNRDKAVWPDADQVRIDRTVGRHLSLGMGSHFCLGAPLARLEGEIAFRTLAEHVPGMELVDSNPLWRPGAVFRGLERLAVRLGN